MKKFDKTKFLGDVYSLTQELNDTYNDDSVKKNFLVHLSFFFFNCRKFYKKSEYANSFAYFLLFPSHISFLLSTP